MLRKGQNREAEAFFRLESLRLENELQTFKSQTPVDSQNADRKSKNQESKLAVRLSEAYFNYAKALHLQGKYDAAETYFLKAIETYRSYMGRPSRFLIQCLSLLAEGYFKQGKLLDAERYYQEKLALQKQLLKPDSLELAVTANNLAAIYQSLGENKQAEGYFQWALNLCSHCKSSLSEADQLADILNNFALFYEKQGELDKARETIDKALLIEKEHQGRAFSVDRARSLLVLASIERKLLEYQRAETHYKEALKLVQKEMPDRADLESEIRQKYAELLLQQHNYEEASPAFLGALAACKRAYGQEHPQLAELLSSYSILLRRLGQEREAESALRRAISIQEKTIGVDTADYLANVHRLASVLSEQHRFAESDQLYDVVLFKLKERLGSLHPFIADTLDNRAVQLEKNGQMEKAENLRSEASLIRRKLARWSSAESQERGLPR